MAQQLIRLPDVLARCALGRSEIYRLVSVGEFPRPVPLGKRATAWESSEVDAWIQARIAARDTTPRDREMIGQRLVAARAKKAAPDRTRRTAKKKTS